MSYKKEVIDALEVYKRNTAHVLGDDSDMTRAIDRCIILADEVEEEQPERKGKWIKISPAGIYECSECGKNVMTDDIDAYKWCHGCGCKMEIPKEDGNG